MTIIAVDSDRIQSKLDKLAMYSDTQAPAITRVLFTPTELEARQYVRDLMVDAGLSVREDAIGNIFGRWQGLDKTLPAVATGSHIDAIPESGRFDGTVGVLGAIEALNVLREQGYEPTRSIEVIMFTAEEPTRFGIGCLGSRALAGTLSVAELQALHDSEGQSLDIVRQVAGYTASLDTVCLDADYYAAFVELHIEQGPILDKEAIDIGVVTAIAAPATLRVIIQGDGGHAGTVLMPGRRDSLPAAAEIILAVEQSAKTSTSPDAVATVGLCEVYPGAVNSIPSRVLLEIDIRDIDLVSRDTMVEKVLEAVETICAKRGLDADAQVLNADEPCQSGDALVAALQSACESQGYTYQSMISRAYHDTLFMARICPTAMLFVPSVDGYSHRPDEYTKPENIARGVAVLAASLRELSAS